MQKVWKYRGRTVSGAEIVFIRELIVGQPEAGRCALSRLLCDAWNWKQLNGAPCEQTCRGLLLTLERAGEIQLPVRNPLAERRPPEPVVPDNRPVRGALHDLLPLEIEQVRRSADEPLFNSLTEQYHYLGYEQPVGEHLKYLVKARGQAIAALAWSSAARHLGARDRFIGWDPPTRRRNIRLIAYNSRYLILPWVEVPHLASHVLGRMAQLVPRDFQRVYAHPIYLLETFVDRERFRGTCYRAANWTVVGETTGRGKDSQSRQPNRSIKQILALPLHRNFRRLLQQ
jgi:Druantia protein DruA